MEIKVIAVFEDDSWYPLDDLAEEVLYAFKYSEASGEPGMSFEDIAQSFGDYYKRNLHRGVR